MTLYVTPEELVAARLDRLLLLVVAAAGAWLLTRPEQRVGAPH